MQIPSATGVTDWMQRTSVWGDVSVTRKYINTMPYTEERLQKQKNLKLCVLTESVSVRLFLSDVQTISDLRVGVLC